MAFGRHSPEARISGQWAMQLQLQVADGAIGRALYLAGWAYLSNLGTFDEDGLIGNKRAALGVQD